MIDGIREFLQFHLHMQIESAVSLPYKLQKTRLRQAQGELRKKENDL